MKARLFWGVLLGVVVGAHAAEQEPVLVRNSPDGTSSAIIFGDGHMVLSSSGRAVYSVRDVQNVIYNPDGSRLLIESNRGTYFEVLNPITGNLIHDRSFTTPMQFVAWARDDIQEFLVLVDVRTGKLWRYNIGVDIRPLERDEEQLLRLESYLN